MAKIRRLALAVPLTLLAACSGSNTSPDGGPPDGGPNAGSASQKFCTGYADAWCDFQTRCGAVLDSGKTDCTAQLVTECGGLVPSASKGYRAFDATLAAKCLSNLEAASCDGYDVAAANGYDCTYVFTPAVDTDGPCLENADCIHQPDETCGGPACARTCRASTGEIGKPCDSDHFCDGFARCDLITNTCVVAHAVGEMCNDESADDGCVDNAACDDQNVSETQTCLALPTMGQPCQLDCDDADYCDLVNDVCKPRVGAGQSCASAQCQAGLYCDTTVEPGTCLAFKGIGDSCATAQIQCDPSLLCDSWTVTSSFTCQPNPTEGQRCRHDSPYPCALGLACDAITDTCVSERTDRPADVGETCDADPEHFGRQGCRAGLVCRGLVAYDGGVGMKGTCTVPALGDPCDPRANGTVTGQCPTRSACVPSTDGGVSTCTPASAGSYCVFNEDCQASDYCNLAAFSCAPYKVAGETCVGAFDCTSPLRCIEVSAGVKQCGALGALDAGCDADSFYPSCEFPLTCQGGTCRHAGAPGEACLLAASALYGLPGCVTGVCESDGGCSDPAVDGSPCFAGSECQSGRCSNNRCISSCQ